MNLCRTTRFSSPSSTRLQNSADEIPIQQVLGYEAYDRTNVSNYLKNHAIHSGFKTRANTAKRSHGFVYRAGCVWERDELGG